MFEAESLRDMERVILNQSKQGQASLGFKAHRKSGELSKLYLVGNNSCSCFHQSQVYERNKYHLYEKRQHKRNQESPQIQIH